MATNNMSTPNHNTNDTHSKMNNCTIAYAAGTSGGHIIPCLTLAKKEREQNKNTHVLFFSTQTPLDNKLTLNNTTIDTHITLPLTTKRYWYSYPLLAAELLRATWNSFWALRKHNTKKVISTGGLIALPVSLAAWLQSIPIELWELNATPGGAISWCAPFASKVVVNVPDAQDHFPTRSCELKPYPVQYPNNTTLNQKAARINLGLDQNKKTILILGGSQGSIFLNSAIKKTIEHQDTLRSHIQIIHQTGTSDARNWQQLYNQLNIPAIVFPFCYDLVPHYAAADMVVCRSGSGTLHETLFFEKPFITIPLEAHTTAHQVDNARAIERLHPKLCTVLLQHQIADDMQLLYDAIITKLNI